MTNSLKTHKKVSVFATLIIFVFTGVFGLGSFFAPRVAQAQFAVTDPALTGLEVKSTTFEIITAALVNTAAIAVLNAANYFAQKVAFDAANYIAAGGKGQKPFFTTDGIGDYLGNVGKDAAGEALGTISQVSGLEKLGINLCSPSSPQVALNIKLGFLNGLPGLLGGPPSRNAPQPKCNWRTISDNWDEFTNLDSDTVLDQVGVMFTPGQSSLSAAIEFNRHSLELIDKKKQESVDDYIAKSGFKDLVSKVSGKVLTPAETIKAEMERTNAKAAETGGDVMLGMTPAAFGKGAFGILPAALQTFAGTLGEKLMKKAFDRGLISLQDLFGSSDDEEDNPFNFDGSGSGGGRAAAELANASLLTPKIFSATNYDELTIFATCPSEGSQPDNCVMDTDLFNGIQRSKQGEPMTVAQALEQGFLHGEKRLLPLGHQDNATLNCYQNSYCYSNLIKLRRARIIPIGWELAASSQFNDVGNPVTLQEVVDNFNNCPLTTDGFVNLDALPDQLHPWCRLIDPDWILKYPEAICTQQAPGPVLLNPIGDVRGDLCVDSQSCILEDENGKCIGGYGYCLAEKSYWRLGGDSCPAQYASCQTVRRTDDGNTFSYLLNTAEVDVCNQGNAGCRQYSRSTNLVSNGGFEELFDSNARDWTRGDVTGLAQNAQSGRNALSLTSGGTDTQAIPSVLAGQQYEISASAIAANTASNGDVLRVGVQFKDINGAVVEEESGGLTTDCPNSSGNSVAFSEIVLSSLGYLSTKCHVTAPPNAVSATMTLVSLGGSAFVDNLALLGSSFSFNPNDTIHLNGKISECPKDQAGCREFVSAANASLNLVRNPGFEEEIIQGGAPSSWSLPDTNQYTTDAAFGLDGVSVISIETSAITQTVTGLLPEATYVFTASSRHATGGTAPLVNATLTILDFAGNATSPDSLGDGCDFSGNNFIVPLPATSEYVRAECQFTTPSDAKDLIISFDSSSDSEVVFVDSVQVELGTQSTAFHEGYAVGAQKVHLKAPPVGLNCTGAETDPQACQGLALSCQREEVGCNLYSPSIGGASIPAITNSGDLCPAECSGYETFRQEPTNFADEEFPLFFIPDSANSCSASEAGCEEFTNLDLAATGGESREYFTSLRLCTNPDANTETFYTWEGSDTEGFQLKVWQLRKSNLSSNATGDIGSDPTGGVGPCTNLTYDSLGAPQCADSEVDENIQACSKLVATFDGDCREFYDIDGNIHYRYFSKTVVATVDCSEYRMTRTNETECRSHGGLWNGSECHYFAVGNESSSCRPEASGCKAYTGNASRNIRIVINDSFESGTTDDWFADVDHESTSSVSNSNESVSAGGHSLKVSSSRIVKDVSEDVREGKTYLLDFWARGSGELNIAFSSAGDEAFTFNRVNDSDAPVEITSDWRPYTIGPVLVVDSPATGATSIDNEHLVFLYEAVGGANLFLDNVVLKEVAEAEYVVANSWNTPASCDQTPGGDVAPQFMLGCQAYTDADNTQNHLKSFSRLCREEAVGCSALYDTQNTPTPFTQAFNAVCTLDSACVPSFGVTCACEVDDTAVCQIAPGGTFCKFDTNELIDERLATDGGNISTSGDTILIPNDELVYLIDTPASRCKEEFKGCTALGLPSFNNEGDTVTEWKTITAFNLPEKYEDELCRSEENFCQAYTRQLDGSALFFKDPLNHTCEYKPSVTINGFKFSGFFKKGTDEACDENFLKGGTEFGIWKNSDTEFDGWVGECPSNFDQCKEFIDPNDTSGAHPEGQPYYAILNDDLDIKTCQNEVSLSSSPKLAEGASACVLFDQTDVLTKRYDSVASYDVSAAKNGELVPVVASDDNDTNIVIRVDRDRRCGEWLDCRSSEKVFNAATGEFQNVCTDYAICNEFTDNGDSTQCTQYVDSLYTGEILTSELYQTRPIGQDGFELSGFSLPNKYPVNELVTINISEDEDDEAEFRLVHSVGIADCGSKDYGDTCGEENVLGNKGRCLGLDGNACVYSIDGSEGYTGTGNLNVSTWNTRYPSSSCRAFPQENSPYPSKVADPTGWNISISKFNNGNPVLISPGPSFKGANVCQRRIDPATNKEYESCECSYQIGEYGRNAESKYFSLFDDNLPTGYCSGGAFEDFECNPRASGERTSSNYSCCSADSGSFDFGSSSGCSDGAECLPLAKVDRVVGYEGQCLERDLRNPINGSFNEFACSTWRPVGVIGGSLDIYNLNQSAGFFVKPDRKFYCAGERTSEFSRLLRFKIGGTNVSALRNVSHDRNGDGRIDPNDLDITNFFGPGKVSKSIGIRNWNTDCKGQAGNGWCIYPGFSYPVSFPVTGNAEDDAAAEGDDRDFAYPPPLNTAHILAPEAVGILGCYSVASGSDASDTYIDYPYTAAPIYKEQLTNIYFQVSDDLYDYGSNIGVGELEIRHVMSAEPTPDDDIDNRVIVIDRAETSVTNPFQRVYKDCEEDNGQDNIDSATNDDIDTENATDAGLIGGESSSQRAARAAAVERSFYFLDETNDWSADASDNQGTITLQGIFDSSDRLTHVRIGASENKNEGTFGINRMGFVFKNGCSSVAQVDVDSYGLTKAYTDRINNFADYSGLSNQVDFAEFGTSCQPWGAIGSISSQPSNVPWTLVTTYSDTENQCTGDSFQKGGRFSNLTTSTVGTSIRKLFRKIDNVWNYNGITNKTSDFNFFKFPRPQTGTSKEGVSAIYTPNSSAKYDDTDTPTTLPVIASVSATNCDASGNCAVEKLHSMNINGRTEGILSVQDGILKAYAKFYGWASHDAMPILSRKIFWGDSTQTEAATTGWYKNQKPFCSPGVAVNDGVGECVGGNGITCISNADCPGSTTCNLEEGNHFGNTPGACRDIPFEFEHVYTCTAADLDRLEECDPADEVDGYATNAPCVRNVDPDGDGITEPSPACVYRPAVQIKDNWDWCNCTGTGCEVESGVPGAGGAYGPDCDSASSDGTRKPWTEFDGELRVFPNPNDVN